MTAMAPSWHISRALPRCTSHHVFLPIKSSSASILHRLPGKTITHPHTPLHGNRISTFTSAAMASSEILSQTLSSITTIKLDQLQKQKAAYDAKKHSLLQDAAIETDTRKRAKFLVDAAEKMPSMTKNPMISTENISRFLHQAQYDPSVSESLLQEYEASLRKELQVQSNKYEFASLYGKLVSEWIAAAKTDDGASTASGSGEFVKVGREEMHEQRATWEEYVFKAKETDGKVIKEYLTGVFKESSKDARRATEALVRNMEEFQKAWEKETHFSTNVLEDCFRGLLRGDLLNDEKRSTLRDFLGNKVVLNEISDVLNMRMAALSSWSWEEPLIIEQRRNLNGRYRFYLDEDLLHTILIYYIGRRWAVQLRKELMNLVRSGGVWKSDSKPISKKDARRRRYFLRTRESEEWTVHKGRLDHFKNVIMLDHLPTSMNEVRGNYGDEDYTKPQDTRKTHADVAQQLLHRIETEVLLQRKLGKSITVIRSDFKWFGPSIPHSTIFAVLDFFGVTTDWQDFFRRVLEAPLRFRDDPVNTPPRTRKRGTPLSTPLADFLGEAILFCLDLAVNQKAGGAKLYRLHDDMWLFGEAETCVKAWGVVSEFTETMGLEFNLEKTGSAQISSAGEGEEVGRQRNPADLPSGQVKWGFLTLDPITGRFALDPAAIKPHISELRVQLLACPSVLDFIQAWNLYAVRFLLRNAGTPANCFSRKHIDSILGVFGDIQRELFPGHKDGVAGYLKEMIAKVAGVVAGDIPTGYLYYPVTLGGLGLLNPFVELLLVRELVAEDPEGEIVEKWLEREEFAWRRARERFERGEWEGVGGSSREGTPSDLDVDKEWEVAAGLRENDWTGEVKNGLGPGPVMGEDFSDLRGEEFFSLEEYTRYRERTSAEMNDAYEKLMARPDEKRVREIVAAGDVKVATGEPEWDTELTSYERWVVQLYHGDMVARFGGLNVVDRELLPTGLMSMLRQSRFQWQG